MRKYENIDIVAALGAVVELNTGHYKSDFKYDIELFKEAARNSDGDNNRLLWISRQSGTHCLQEREVYIKDTSAFHTWNAYGKLLGSPDFYRPVVVEDRIIAYAVNITGIEKGRIKGDLYELDYREHIRKLDKFALPLHTVTVVYKDGTTLTMLNKEHEVQHEKLYRQHGQLQTLKSYTEDAGALRDILQQVRNKRENEAHPAIFKLRVRNQKPSIRQQIESGKKQLNEKQTATPARTAAKNNNVGLEN